MGINDDVFKCFNCGRLGHLTEDCQRSLTFQDGCKKKDSYGTTPQYVSNKESEEKRRWRVTITLAKRCNRCGNLGHVVSCCRVNTLLCCKNCGRKGHLNKACPKAVCRLCNSQGHSSALCPSKRKTLQHLWRRLDQRQKDTQAFYLEKSNHKQEKSKASISASRRGVSSGVSAIPKKFTSQSTKCEINDNQKSWVNMDHKENTSGGLMNTDFFRSTRSKVQLTITRKPELL